MKQSKKYNYYWMLMYDDESTGIVMSTSQMHRYCKYSEYVYGRKPEFKLIPGRYSFLPENLLVACVKDEEGESTYTGIEPISFLTNHPKGVLYYENTDVKGIIFYIKTLKDESRSDLLKRIEVKKKIIINILNTKREMFREPSKDEMEIDFPVGECLVLDELDEVK